MAFKLPFNLKQNILVVVYGILFTYPTYLLLGYFMSGAEHSINIRSESGSIESTTTYRGTPKNYTQDYFQRKQPPKQKNILLIISDDLRPQLNSYYGRNSPNPASLFKMHTPNLDKLAERSMMFSRAYAQFSVCGPSRTSFLTGRRPDTTRVWDLTTYWRTAGGNFTTIPQYFKEHGYSTIGFGKVFHKGQVSNYNDPISWTEPTVHSIYSELWKRSSRTSWYSASVEIRKQYPLPDEDINRMAIKKLHGLAQDLKMNAKPFFLAVGYVKPHMKYDCPQEFFDLYPFSEIEHVNNSYYPKDFPDIHWYPPEAGKYKDNVQYNCSEFAGEFRCQLPRKVELFQRRAYFACVSYIDNLIGKLLGELDLLGLRESTVVSVIGDHGYHLGENGLYGKHTALELSTRVPFFLSIPGQTDRGMNSNALVELVDLFPTLAEASGTGRIKQCPPSSRTIKLCTEGKSLIPLIQHPEMSLKKYAISQMKRNGSMGYSLRNHRYRYIEWIKVEYTKTDRFSVKVFCDRLMRAPVARELYDHIVDPEENANVADVPIYQATIKELQLLLREAVTHDKALGFPEAIFTRRNLHFSCA